MYTIIYCNNNFIINKTNLNPSDNLVEKIKKTVSLFSLSIN